MTKLWHGLIPLVPEGWPADEPLLLLKDVDYLWRKSAAEPLDAERLARAWERLPDLLPFFPWYEATAEEAAAALATAYAAETPEDGE